MQANVFWVCRTSLTENDALYPFMPELIKIEIYRCIAENGYRILFSLVISFTGHSVNYQKRTSLEKNCRSTLRSLSVFHTYGLENRRSKVHHFYILNTPPRCNHSEKPACPVVYICKVCNIFIKSLWDQSPNFIEHIRRDGRHQALRTCKKSSYYFSYAARRTFEHPEKRKKSGASEASSDTILYYSKLICIGLYMIGPKGFQRD
jgi:hypothetical protein